MAGTDATIQLLTAVRAALAADSALTAIVSTRIYDLPPANAVAPYITTDGTYYTDWSTDSFDGQEVSIDVHAWDQPASMAPTTRRVRDMMARIRAVLHRTSLSLSTSNLVLLTADNARGPILDPDGSTVHGIVTVRALIQN